jgi:putative oxidoreductase
MAPRPVAAAAASDQIEADQRTRALEPDMDLALLVLRCAIGLLFIAHGTQKLLGFRQTAELFESLNMRPGRMHAAAAATAETAGGALLALGLLTPIGAVLTIATMVAAVLTVHLPRGFWNTNGGYEFNAVLVAAAFALAGTGPGAWSLDNALGIDWASTGWALVALAAGLLGGAGAVLSGRMVSTRGDRPASHPTSADAR